MKLLVFMTTWLLISCGDPTAYEAKGSEALLIRRVTKNKIIGRVVRGEMPDKRLQSKLAQRVTHLRTEGISMQEARQYLSERETFFHTFFAMRDSAGGDMRLIEMLGIDVKVYFDLLQRLQLPAPEQLAKIISAVAKNDRLLPFYNRLVYHVDMETAIDARKINFPLGNSTVNNPELAASMRRRLNRMRAGAEQENTLRTLAQPELLVQIWIRQGQTTSEILYNMAKNVGGITELARRLDISEPLLRSCIRSSVRNSCKIERILSRTKSDASFKPFADKLERSAAMEQAIDAGAIIKQRAAGELILNRVVANAATLHAFQRQLQAKRVTAITGNR